jgi:hypothetical protein
VLNTLPNIRDGPPGWVADHNLLLKDNLPKQAVVVSHSFRLRLLYCEGL